MTSIRISLNVKKIDGPYGGGNQFANALEQYLVLKGHNVFRSLVPKLDMILIVSSKRHHLTTAYDMDEIAEYKILNPNTVIVHRINSIDEQRGIDLGINAAMLQANHLADHTIFISAFLRDFFTAKGMDVSMPNSVIFNGAGEDIFHPRGRVDWSPGKKLRLVTHHWSSNYMKGFDIYERLDQLLDVEPFRELFEFTIIGNIPLGINFQNSKVIPPIHGKELGELLRQHHVYLTAARNEAAGMHHIEGMRCGLPVLYLNSGAMPEYCSPFGIEFNLINFEKKLLQMVDGYSQLRDDVLNCPYSAKWMSEQYETLFMQLNKSRQKKILTKPGFGLRFKVNWIDRPGRKIRKLRSFLKKVRDNGV